MQKLTDEMVNKHAIEPDEIKAENIPAIEGAKFYFALVDHNGKKVLCILDDSDKWRPVSYQEMMGLMS